jgi:hypothetical protein
MTTGFEVIVFSTLPIGFRPGIRPGGFVGLRSFPRRHRGNPAALELTLDCRRSRVCGCGTSRRRPGVLPVTEFRRFVPRMGPVDKFYCHSNRTGRGVHCGCMISARVLDVFQFDCRRKIPYCCVMAGHRCVFLAGNYDRAMRLRSGAPEHRQQNHNSACVHVASLLGQSEINLHISGRLLFFIR